MKQLSIWLCMSIAEVRQLHAGIKPHVEQVLLEAQAEADVVAKEKAIDRVNESLFGPYQSLLFEMYAVVWFELNKDLCLSFFKGKQRIVAEEKLFPDPPLTPKKIIERLRGGGMGGYAGRNVSSKLFHHIWDEFQVAGIGVEGE
jgi:hypothetical protein